MFVISFNIYLFIYFSVKYAIQSNDCDVFLNKQSILFYSIPNVIPKVVNNTRIIMGIFLHAIFNVVSNMKTFPHVIPKVVNIPGTFSHAIPNRVNNMETFRFVVPMVVNNWGTFPHGIPNDWNNMEHFLM